jgi:hypothetical protein
MSGRRRRMVFRCLAVESGEGHVDSEASAGSGVCRDSGLMSGRDRLHDRESEPGPVSGGSCVWAESLERLEQSLELAGRDHRSGVRDREGGASSGGVRDDVEPAVGDVVADGIRDQVRHEALDELRVAGRSGRLEHRGAPQSLMIVASQDGGGRRGEVDGVSPQASVVAPGERQQRLEQPFLAPAGRDDALAHLSQGDRVRVRVGERRLRQRELDGDLTAELVRGVGEELLLRFGCCKGRGDAHRTSSPVQPERIAGPSERLLRAC